MRAYPEKKPGDVGSPLQSKRYGQSIKRTETKIECMDLVTEEKSRNRTGVELREALF